MGMLQERTRMSERNFIDYVLEGVRPRGRQKMERGCEKKTARPDN